MNIHERKVITVTDDYLNYYTCNITANKDDTIEGNFSFITNGNIPYYIDSHNLRTYDQGQYEVFKSRKVTPEAIAYVIWRQENI